MSIFYTFPYKNSADDFSPTLFIIEPFFCKIYKNFFRTNSYTSISQAIRLKT